MLAIAALLQAERVPLAEVQSSAITRPGQRQPIPSEVAAGPTGRMRLHVQDSGALQRVQALRAFQAGQDTVTSPVQELGFSGQMPVRRALSPATPTPSSA